MKFVLYGYTFRYFYDCDVDELGHIDVEGYEVYDCEGNLIASIEYITEKAIRGMNEDEIYNLIEKYSVNK